MNINPLKWFSSGAPKAEPALPPVAAKWTPSPNFATRLGVAIDTIVLHNTAGPLAPSILRLCDETAEVSAHYLVDRDASIYQLVRDDMCAWHAGNREMNRRSIGIEIVAYPKATGMTTEQEVAVTKLVALLLKKYKIDPARIVPHRSVVATACPSFVWPTDEQFSKWVAIRFTKGQE